MKHFIVIGISLVLLTAGTALAVKPDKPGGGDDWASAVQAETDARIEADAVLQSQIDTNAQNVTTNSNDISNNILGIADNAAQIQANTNAINAEEASRQAEDAALQSQINALINNNMAAPASVMYLSEKDSNTPPDCPEFWAEAALSDVGVGDGWYNKVRTCFYCAH